MRACRRRSARRIGRGALLGLSLLLAAGTVIGAARFHAEQVPRSPVARSSSAALGLRSAPARRLDGATDIAPHAPLVWSDEFSQPAGASPFGPTWSFDLGGDGWGNGELECNTDARANSVENGQGELILTARYAPGTICADGSVDDYTSARISSAGLRTMTYGHVRVRAKLPTGSGVWPAIWALGSDGAQVGYPGSGEIDIAEVVGTSPTTVYGTIHGPSYGPQPYTVSGSATLAEPVSRQFHVYGLDWTPDAISFSIDGHVYSTVTRAETVRRGTWVFDHPFYLLLDVAVGGNFPGPPQDPSTFPQSMVVDYVRVYS